tara:strand:+ start:587 stop:823 length:237 start_codon:yes stop_codon:yes gene_type:complete
MPNVTIRHDSFLELDFEPHDNNAGGNADKYTFKIRAEGQNIQVGGVEVDELEFVVVGPCELDDLFSAMALASRMKHLL